MGGVEDQGIGGNKLFFGSGKRALRESFIATD